LTLLEAPPGTLGVVRMPVPFFARDGASRGTPCLAVFWLDKTWPDAPTVTLESGAGTDPLRVPRVRRSQARHHDVLPIHGRVFVAGTPDEVEAALPALFEAALERLSPMIAAAKGAKRTTEEELAAYAWDLRLLAARLDEDPVRELAKDRPDQALMRVAARRASHVIDRATGDAEPRVVDRHIDADPPDDSDPIPALGATGWATAPPPEEPGFFAGLVRTIVDLVSSSTPVAIVPDSPLTTALSRAIVAMKLTGDPALSVIETDRGRPVRYDTRRKVVLVNTKHTTLRAIAAHPSLVLHVLAAAVSEINRELVPVTDAEELKVLLDLLREG
jgi:hypothetical protein